MELGAWSLERGAGSGERPISDSGGRKKKRRGSRGALPRQGGWGEGIFFGCW
jgi:hypothetical protein